MGPEGLLAEGLGEMGFKPGGEAIRSFMLYLSELKKWRRAYSLTSLRTDEDIVVKHFLDSALYLKALRGPEINRVADVGSGAGFPGLPVRILRPGLAVSLIEPTKKKAAFLRHMVGVLRLEGVEVVEKRVEELKGMLFDAALTRALFKADEFVKKASHIVRSGGIFVMSKGPGFAEEIKRTSLRFEIMELELPVAKIKRHFLIIKNEN